MDSDNNNNLVENENKTLCPENSQQSIPSNLSDDTKNVPYNKDTKGNLEEEMEISSMSDSLILEASVASTLGKFDDGMEQFDPKINDEEEDVSEFLSSEEKPFLLDMEKLKQFQTFPRPKLPPMKATSNHSFLFKLPVHESDAIIPDPDQWMDDDGYQVDRSCVIMPYSAHNVMICRNSQHTDSPHSQQQEHQQQHHHQPQHQQSYKVKRWTIVMSSLYKLQNMFIKNSLDIEKTIQSYHKRSHDYTNLHVYFQEISPEKHVEFFEKILPGMIDLVLNSEFTCTKPIPFLDHLLNASLSMTKHQAACILANAFFCTFPTVGRKNDLPDINFFGLYKESSNGCKSSQLAKLDCLINYFKRVVTCNPGDGVLTFTRQVLDDPPSNQFWKNSKSMLRDMLMSSEGLIEKDGEGMLQVDFANRYLGGGVLRKGCVQEEIRFITCPEAIVSCLISKSLLPNECLIMKGIETYSAYTGYAQSFRFAGDFKDCTPRDSWRRLETEIVAIDAQPFQQSAADQFHEDCILRELNKSYCGFKSPSNDPLPPVATGKWGCGAFKGNAELKAMIQLMSASQSGRDVLFLTFGDAHLAERLHSLHCLLRDCKKNVGDLWNYITEYDLYKYDQSLFDYINDSITSESDANNNFTNLKPN